MNSLGLKPATFRHASYYLNKLGFSGVARRKRPLLPSCSCSLAVTVGNKSVSKEASVRYSWHMFQQAGYQRRSVVAILPQTHPFWNMSQYIIHKNMKKWHNFPLTFTIRYVPNVCGIRLKKLIIRRIGSYVIRFQGQGFLKMKYFYTDIQN
jgi:hypothetical protein